MKVTDYLSQRILLRHFCLSFVQYDWLSLTETLSIAFLLQLEKRLRLLLTLWAKSQKQMSPLQFFWQRLTLILWINWLIHQRLHWQRFLISQLFNLVSIRYSSEVKSAVANVAGRIVFGSDSGIRVCCIVSPRLEGKCCWKGFWKVGFFCEEATFLMEVLAHIGIQTLVQTLTAGNNGFLIDSWYWTGSSTQSNKPGDIAFIADCVDWTSVHPVPQSLSLGQFINKPPLSTR